MARILTEAERDADGWDADGTGVPEVEQNFRQCLRLFDSAVSPMTAGWLAGYARTTVVLSEKSALDSEPLPRIVVASPLYVEYSTPPTPGPRVH
jgi:hypothetical protein